jgi:hypothetical protein
MAEGIVVGLKTIDVEHDQRERRQFTDSTTPFLVQEVVKLAPVGNAGEAIKTGQAQQHLICFLELTHDLKELLLPSPSAGRFRGPIATLIERESGARFC